MQYVLNCGSLLQRLPWKRRSKLSSVVGSYVFHVVKKYDKAVAAFDGYEHGPAPKDVTRNIRTDVSKGIEVKFQEDVALAIRKEVFLAKKKNKQRFINILGQKLEDTGCTVHHAVGNADLLTVTKTVDLSGTTDTILVCEDTNLSVLLLHYTGHNIRYFFVLEPKQNATKRSECRDTQL